MVVGRNVSGGKISLGKVVVRRKIDEPLTHGDYPVPVLFIAKLVHDFLVFGHYIGPVAALGLVFEESKNHVGFLGGILLSLQVRQCFVLFFGGFLRPYRGRRKDQAGNKQEAKE